MQFRYEICEFRAIWRDLHWIYDVVRMQKPYEFISILRVIF